MKVPERWLNYKPSGRIAGTRFVAFKVPLDEKYCKTLSSVESFNSKKLLELYPGLKMVIDLTYTSKYYNYVEEFEKNGVYYVKLKCKGIVVPSTKVFEKFTNIVENFMSKTPQDYLIGVHCTHGVNRTGYLIVRYMIERLGYKPERALKEFLLSRGHAIERSNYISDLKQRRSKRNKIFNRQQ